MLKRYVTAAFLSVVAFSAVAHTKSISANGATLDQAVRNLEIKAQQEGGGLRKLPRPAGRIMFTRQR
ncbi:hypothetical protein [Yokenella regensburgei]|uniref:hypothetical protein n=1 Tax=Yokenella regensburgei TaxID=158877 RepID=UPI0013761702|nr:hypothetical protein [Yokenella regensburgei]KAF1368964.1 hypothetical protein FHR25_002714 [Yokenella regensburgei]